MARVSCDTHASIGYQRAGAPLKTPIAPPGVMRAGGAISHPLRETDVDLGPHGPGSFPPACTLLSRAYHEPHPPSSSRSKPSGRPPNPVTFPPTASIRWNRNATPPRLGAKAGRTPRRSAAQAAANAAARLRPVRRDGDSTLAFIERRFSLDSNGIQYPECKKSRLRGLPQRANLALLRWSSGELFQRQPSNRGPTGRDSRSSSRQFSKRGRSAQVWGT